MDISSGKITELDSFDAALLSLLKKNAQLTSAELGEKVGLSPSAAHRRVKLLEERGLILGYRAVLSDEAEGRRGTVFVNVTLTDQRRETIEKFERAIVHCDPITECHLMTGDADYLLKVVLRGGTSFEAVHRDVLTTLPGVSRLVSHFSIRPIKAAG